MLTNSRYTVITGHYGSGKTNLAVNMAIDLKNEGKKVIVVDLDIVNPYFRTADFTKLFEQKGIQIIAPPYACSNVDIPVLTAQVFSVFADSEAYVIFDVGGDDAGAVALGQYKAYFDKSGYEMYYVINKYRYLTRTANEAAELLCDIEAASRLKATGIINNSNLANETTAQTVLNSISFAEQTAAKTGLAVALTTAPKGEAEKVAKAINNVYPVDIYVKTVWD